MDIATLPAERDPGAYSAQVRVWSTGKLMDLVGVLTPYVNGSFGEVLPEHARIYIGAISEINRMWRVGAPLSTPVQEQEVDPVVASARMRSRVSAQLAALVSRSSS